MRSAADSPPRRTDGISPAGNLSVDRARVLSPRPGELADRQKLLTFVNVGLHVSTFFG
jgi:hypothetical protein